MQYCPCGTKKNYTACCGLYIDEQKKPDTPEALMRSRYTAYTRANIDYIIKTMKAPAANNFDPESAREWSTNVKWLGLEVLNTSSNHSKGYVEFIAHFIEQGNEQHIHEISEFHKINNEWYYVDGKVEQAKSPEKTQVGRNELCPCGSGKKYKKCCLDNN